MSSGGPPHGPLATPADDGGNVDPSASLRPRVAASPRTWIGGCTVGPDAHSIEELDLTRWGVLMAQKGAVPAERVLKPSTATLSHAG